jgi:hypothetical protein
MEPKSLGSGRDERIQGKWKTYLDEQEHKWMNYNAKENNKASNRSLIAKLLAKRLEASLMGLQRLGMWETHFIE